MNTRARLFIETGPGQLEEVTGHPLLKLLNGPPGQLERLQAAAEALDTLLEGSGNERRVG